MPQFQQPLRSKRTRFSPYFIKRLSTWLVMSTALAVTVSARAQGTLPPGSNGASAPVGTLDLNGGIVTASSFWSDFQGAGSNGMVINSSPNPAIFVINEDATIENFSGNISGNISLARTGVTGISFILSGSNTYTGTTLLEGGSNMTLVDGGTLSGTTSITIDFTSLILNNAGTTNLSDRVNNAASITLNGGGINLLGAVSTLSSENLGAVTLASGASTLSAANGGNDGVNLSEGATLTLASLTRNAANGATVMFAQSSPNPTLGQLGLPQSSAAANNIFVTGGITLTDNIIGPWALANSGSSAATSVELASYNSATGVGALSTTGYAGYDTSLTNTAIPVGNIPTQNVRLTVNTATPYALPSGGLTVNALDVANVAPGQTANSSPTITLSFANSTDVLNVVSGALVLQNVTNSPTTAGSVVLGSTVNSGMITAGGTNPTGPTDLYLYYNNTTPTSSLTVNSAIVDNPNNGGEPVRLILWGGNTGSGTNPSTINLAGANSYSGGTIVNQENVTFSGTLPGNGLTINNGAVTQLAGGIFTPQAVTINGAGSLTLTGNNTLTGLTFNNDGGGTTAPTLAIGTGVTSLNATTITASSSNIASTATISGIGTLDLAGGDLTITVNPIQFAGQNISPYAPTLNISSIITSTTGFYGITVTGGGLLQLDGRSTFSGGVTVESGGIIVGTNSVGTAGNVTSGPLGTGTLTLDANTSLLSSTASTLANSVNANGDFTFSGTNALTLSGFISLTQTSGNENITVTSSQMTATISGSIFNSGMTSLTKLGQGTLSLTNVSNSFFAPTIIAGGTLNVANDLSFGFVPSPATANAITIENGAALGTTADTTINALRGITIGAGGGSFTPANTLTINSQITDNGNGFTMAGKGTLILNANNTGTLTGRVTVSSGQLRAIDGQGLATASNLTLNGGVFETSGLFTRGLGSGNDSVQILGGTTGFSANNTSGSPAVGSPVTIDLGGDGTGTGPALVWGSAYFNPAVLLLNDTTANTQLQFLNAIDLNNTGVPLARTFTVNSTATGAIATLGGALTNSNGAATIIKTGNGILALSNTGNSFTGNVTIAAGTLQLDSPAVLPAGTPINLTGGILGLAYDGDLTGTPQTMTTPFSQNIIFVNTATIAVGRVGIGAGFPPIYTQATNKTIQLTGTISFGQLPSPTLTVNNNNGDGLEILSSESWTLPSGVNFAVTNATASNLVQGLTLDALLTGTFTKSGAGALVLNNPSNTFTGNINITSGVISIASDSGSGSSVLGAAANKIQLDPSTGTSTLRATGTFTLAHQIQLTNTANTRAIEVTGGNTLTINTAFDLNGTAGNNAPLVKNDNGTLLLTVANPSAWVGGITINSGILEITVPGALGGSTNKVNVGAASGAALQIGATMTIANTINLNSTTNGSGGSGINSQGTLEILPGFTVTTNGSLSMTEDGWIGADTGAILDIQGGISSPNNRFLYFTGAGTINVNSTLPATLFQMEKNGTGTVNFTVPETTAIGKTVLIFKGTLLLSEGGTLNNASAGFTIEDGATLSIDDSVTATANRLGTATVSMSGGIFTIKPNAAGSSQTAGALSLGSGGSTINLLGGGNSTLTFASLGQSAGATLNYVVSPGATLGAGGNQVFFTTPPALLPVTGGILARDTVTNGANFDFATYDATNGVTAFTGYNASTASDINLAGATDTVQVNSGFTNTTISGSKTLNALAFNGDGLTVSGAPNNILTLTSGGILVNSATHGDMLSVPVVAFAGIEGIFHINTDSTLTVTSALTGTGGINKSDGGTMILDTPTFDTGTTTLNGGLLTLAGGTNTLNYTSGLTVNGGTLELAGNSQTVGALTSGANTTGLGGIIQSTAATQAVLAVNAGSGSSSFGGQITGNIFLSRAGTNTVTFTNNNTYTGGTWLTGGTTTLTDQGAFSNTSSIEIDYGSLSLNENGTAYLADRISNSAPITMKGGTILLTGRVQTDVSETLGAVTAAQGLNTFNASTTAGGTVFSATLNLTSLTVSNDAVVDFASNTTLGQLGNFGRIIINSYTGNQAFLGGWAVVNGIDFAGYNSVLGVGALNAAGFAGYDGTTLLASSTATQNLKISASQFFPSISGTPLTLTINSLNMAGVVDLNFNNNTDILNLASGGLLRNGAGSDFIGGLTPNNGNLTAGGTQSTGTADLYVYNNQNSLTIESAVINNPNGAAVRLVISGGGTTTLGFSVPSVGTIYSGGLVVNSSTVNLTDTSRLPGGSITLNDSTFNTSGGSAFATNPFFTLNDSFVNFNRSATLAGLTFNGSGSDGELVSLNSAVGMALSLPSDGSGITSNPTSVSTNEIATINSNNALDTLSLNGVTQTFTVHPVMINGVSVAPLQSGLTINAPIVDGSAPGSIVLTGGGVLQLSSGANTFSGGIDIKGGSSLIVGASSTLSQDGTTILSGPLGTGTLTLESGATVMSSNSANTVANNVVFNTPNGTYTFNGANSLSLTGTISLPDNLTINVVNPGMTVNLGGTIVDSETPGGAITITENGLGTLVLDQSFVGTIISGGGNMSLAFFTDGTGSFLGTGDPQLVPFSTSVSLSSDTIMSVGRLGSSLAPLYTTASNKTVVLSNVALNGNDLTVNNLNGYGLQISSNEVLSGSQTFSVVTATASNVTQGLILTGVLSGASNIVKAGAGTLVLDNANNTFTGNIIVNSGVISIANDNTGSASNLGAESNEIILAPTTGTATLRATGTFTLDHKIQFATSGNTRAIEVTGGNTLTISLPFDLDGGAGNNASLVKNDNGTLVLDAANLPDWVGNITVNAGILKITNPNLFGSSTNQILVGSASGAAIQIGVSMTLANPVTINNTGANGGTGINTQGALEILKGFTVMTTAPLTMTADSWIGVDQDATLNIEGGIQVPNSNGYSIFFTGAGTTNLDSLLPAQLYSIQKFGTGTLNVTVAETNPINNRPVEVTQGTLVLSGNGAFINTPGFQVQDGATLSIDDSATKVSGRLGGDPVSIDGGTFTYKPNAAGSSETAGALNLGGGGSTITILDGGALTLTFASLNQTSSDTLNIIASNLGTTNQILFTTAPGLVPASMGILPRITVNGTDFATYGSTGLVAYGNYFTGADINAATSTSVPKVTSATTTSNITTSETFDALLISGNNLTVGGAPGTTMTLSTGAVLATGGNNTLSVPILATAGVGAVFEINTGAALNVTGAVTGTGGLTKGLGGSLTLSAPDYLTGTNVINSGTVTLAGGANTLYENQALQVNVGGTLDLGGNVEYVNTLSDSNQSVPVTANTVVPGAGGTIKGSAGSLLVTQIGTATVGATTFNGFITGGVGLVVASPNALYTEYLESDDTYSGATTVTGGDLRLRDNGSLSNTSSIALNYGTLILDNSNLSDNANRLNDSAPLTMNGGSLTFYGRTGSMSSETVGVVTLSSGSSTISAETGNGISAFGPQSAIVTLSGLVHNPGATVEFAQNYIGTSAGQLGTLGSNQESILINGSVPLTNNIIGPWAVVNSGYFLTTSVEFASYMTTYGVGALTTAGYAGYDASLTAGPTTSNMATENVRITTGAGSGASPVNIALPAGGFTAYTLNVANLAPSITGTGVTASSSNGFNITFNRPTDVLNLAGGGIIIQDLVSGGGGGAVTIGSFFSPGIITAGGTNPTSPQDLYFYYNNTVEANALTIFSQIADNAGEPVRMIFWGGNQIVSKVSPPTPLPLPVIVLANPNNTYSGGTIINQEEVDIGDLLNDAGSLPAGGLTINGGTVVQVNGTIAPQAVTLNGSSVLTLSGDNTLTSLAINNIGGSTNPSVNTGGILTLSSATPITVTSDNVATLPVINGTLALKSGVDTIDVAPISVNGQTISAISPSLNIAATITGTESLKKTGTGNLELSGSSTFSGGVTLTAGGIVIGANSTPNTIGSTVTSGPLGTGTLIFDSNTTLLSAGNFTIANNVIFSGEDGSFTFNGANNLTLNGTITLPESLTINVVNPGMTINLAGNIVDGDNPGGLITITKNGLGTLVVGQSFAGTVISQGGNASLSFLTDGLAPFLGTGDPQAVSFGTSVILGSDTTITVGRLGNSLAPLFTTASNKTVVLSNVTLNGHAITVNNLNGYGLEISSDEVLSGSQTFSVTTATASNVTQGLTLSGVLSGASNILKTGAGTLVLANAGNTFTGNILINSGVVSIGGDDTNPGSPLGAASNEILLAPVPVGGTSTLRYAPDNTDDPSLTLTLNNKIQFTGTANTRAIEVSAGNTLTVNAAFDLNGAAGTNASLVKNDNGTLILAHANPGWSGGVTVNAGALEITDGSALGSGAVTISSTSGAAIQIGANISLPNPINVTTSSTGINNHGALEVLPGVTAFTTGLLTSANDVWIGADGADSVLNIEGGIQISASPFSVYFVGAGTINLDSLLPTKVYYVQKAGTGTLNITVVEPNLINSRAISVAQGTVALTGNGSFTNNGLGFLVQDGATLTVDDTSKAIANRLGGGTLTMDGGIFNYLPNASGSSETLAALALGAGSSTINISTGNVTMTFAKWSQVANNTLNIVSSSLGSNDKILFTTAPGLTSSMLPQVTVNGTDFATYDSNNGIIAYAGYFAGADINAATSSSTVKVTSATTTASLGTSETINALLISGDGLTVGGRAGSTMTLASGSVLATGGNDTLSVPILATAGAGATFMINTGATLNVTSAITGTGGLITGLGGTLNLSTPDFLTGSTTINAGTVVLGSDNTLYQNQALQVNSGGTLDLGGHVEYVNSLTTVNTAAPGAGGTITGTTGSLLVIQVGSATPVFEGFITGSAGLVISSATPTNTQYLESMESYSGATTVTGGDLRLRDNASLSNTSAITLDYGTLILDNSNLSDSPDRLNNSAPLTMNGGNLTFYGRVQTMSSETVGVVTLSSGSSIISAETGAAVSAFGPQSAILTLSGLVHNSGATVEFSQNYINGSAGQLGTLGSNQESIIVTGGVPLTNNIIGPWAVVNSSYFATTSVEFASYMATYGVGALTTAGYAGYDASLTTGPTTSNMPTANVRITTGAGAVGSPVNIALPAGGLTAYTLNVSNVAPSTTGTGVTAGSSNGFTITFNQPTDVLNLAGGGIIIQDLVSGGTGGAVTIGSPFSPGIITAGGANPTSSQDLYFYYNNTVAANTLTIYSQIADNGSEPVRMIYWGGNQIASKSTPPTVQPNPVIVLANSNNTYSGGTIINQEEVEIGDLLNDTGSLPAGGLTINGGAVIQVNGTIAPQAVTLNGSSILTLSGDNTLTSLTFGNIGGSTAPTVNTGGTLTLSSSTPISITSDNVATLPVINGTLALAAGVDTIDVEPISLSGQTLTTISPTLNIAAAITGTESLNKTGAGILQLSGASTFSGGITLTTGAISIGANSTPSAIGSTVTSGPLGIGTLTFNANTTLFSAGNFAVANNVVFNGLNGMFTFNGSSNLTLNGTITLPNALSIDVVNPAMTATLGGNIVDGITPGGAITITKSGLGTLGLSSTFTGNIISQGGALSFLTDGTGTGTPDVVNLSVNISLSAQTGITVGHLGTSQAPLFANALNKTLEFSSFALNGNSLSVNNLNGYGLLIPDNEAFTGEVTFNVSTASISTVTQGLTMTGVLSGAADIIKTGAGTLVLNAGTAGNTFGGSGYQIDIQGGVVSVSRDSDLGDASNQILLDTNAKTAGGLRVTGSFSTGRTIVLNQVSNEIEVTAGNTLTLTSAFALSTVSNAFYKNDAGTLVLTASNPTWTGAIQVNDGALQVSGPNGAILGSGPILINQANTVDSNIALQLSGGATLANPLTLQNGSGINAAGALESVSGNNVYSGAITLTLGADFIGVDNGSNLTVSGGITGAFPLVLTGAGTGTINSVIATGTGTLTKMGSGEWDLTGANTFTGNIAVNAGTLSIMGTAGALAATGTAPITVQPGGTLQVDDSGTHVANRLGTGARPLALNGGALTIIGNASTATSETIGSGTLTLGSGGSTVTLNANGGPGVTLTVGALSAPTSGATALLRGTNFGASGGANLVVTTAPTLVGGGGALGSTTLSIRPDIIGDTGLTGSGTGFVTYISGVGFHVLTSSELATSINAGSTANAGLSGATSLSSSAAINSLTLQTGATLAEGNSATLTVGAAGGAGILALDTSTAGNTITGGFITTVSNAPLFVQAIGNLTIGSVITGTSGGLTKAGGGALDFTTAQNYTGTTTINGGTLQLAAGVTNTLVAGNALVVNVGGKLDLNGGVQYVGNLSSQGAAISSLTAFGGVGGGAITSSTGTGMLVVNENAVTSYAGSIDGSGVSFVRSGNSTLNLLGALTYGGPTLINGGAGLIASGTVGTGTVLADNGALTNTSSITINYAGLSLDNSKLVGLTNRLPDGAPITMNGGTLDFYGRNDTDASETVGIVTLGQGTSVISAANHDYGATPYSATLTLSGLVRTVTPGTGTMDSTLDFGQNYFTQSGNSLGLLGLGERIVVTGGIPLTNNIVGGFGIVTGYFNTTLAEFASYIPNIGVGALNTAGYAGYDGTAIPVSNAPTQNIRLTAGGTVTSGGLVLNSLNLASNQATAIALNFANASDTLDITSGGLLVQNVSNNAAGTTTIGTTAIPGVLTAGGLNPSGVTDLYLYYFADSAATLTINSKISDNLNGTAGNQSVRLDAWGGDWGASTIILTNSGNSYTGGTVINQENLQIGTSAIAGNLPAGGITVNGGSLKQVKGVIAAQDVNINGGGTVTLTGNNTLGNLTFNDNGGSTVPTLTPTGTLTLTGSITSSSSNVATIATIGAGVLDLNGNNSFQMTVNPVDPFGTGANVAPLQSGLTINAQIQHGGIVKKGNGTLLLASTANNYTGNTTIMAGRLKLGAAGVIPDASNLVIGANGILDLAGFSETVASLAGDTTTTGGVVTDSGAAATLTAGGNNTSTTFAGSIVNGPGAVGFTKAGTGTLTLSGASTYTGVTSVPAGTVIVSGSISGTSSVTVGGSTGNAVLKAAGSITSPGGITVANKGLLSGAGTISGAVTVNSGGTLAPDASAAGLTIAQGSITLQSGSTFQLSLANSNGAAHNAPALSDYSKLTLATGVSATIGGNIVASAAGNVNPMDLFTIILSGTKVTGTFANTTLVTGSTYAFTSGGVSYEINYAFNSANYTSGKSSFEADTGGTSVAVLVLAVPEPNSWAMLVGSLGLTLGLQRFRRRRV